jgi:hypothetical protein
MIRPGGHRGSEVVEGETVLAHQPAETTAESSPAIPVLELGAEGQTIRTSKDE